MSNKITKWIIYGFSTTIVFSVLMLLAYFFNFYYADFPFTLPIPLSRDNAEWGNFGSFISGVFGFVSAMATVFTLLYIAKQHKEIMTLQEKVTADQKYLAAKQLEVIAFEKHEKHLAAFISNCIEIEGIVLNQLEMKYKRTLYKDIFYDNSYKNTDYTVSIFDKNSKLNLFIKFFEAINKEITYLNSNFEKNELCNRKINNLIHDIYCLSAYMYIEFNDAVQDNGSIYYGTAFPSLNIFMVKKQLNQLHQVLEQLTFFCSKNEKSEPLTLEKPTNKLIIEMILTSFSDNFKINLHKHELHITNKDNLIKAMIKTYHNTRNLKLENLNNNDRDSINNFNNEMKHIIGIDIFSKTEENTKDLINLTSESNGILQSIKKIDFQEFSNINSMIYQLY